MIRFDPSRPRKDEPVSEEIMLRIHAQVKTPRKLGAVMKLEGALTDSATVFRHGGRWYMYFTAIGKETRTSGYETHLAESDDLANWTYKCRIFRRDASGNGWDSRQIAGYAAFPDIGFGASNKLASPGGKYYMSYLAGCSDGYEPDPLFMGLAGTADPADPGAFRRLPEPILKPGDADRRPGEELTLYKSYMFEDPELITGFRYVNAYNAKAADGRERIFLAVSGDAEHWERYGDRCVIDDVSKNPAARISGDPQIVKIGDIYVMFYFRYDPGKPAWNTFACSYDLVRWTRWDGEPLIRSEYAWEDVHAHKSWVIKYEDKVWHYYTAVNSAGERFIALATS